MLLLGILAPGTSPTEVSWGRTLHKWLVPPLPCQPSLSGGGRCHVNLTCAVLYMMMPLSRRTQLNLPLYSSFTENLLLPPSPSNCTFNHHTLPRRNLACRPCPWYSRGLFLVPFYKTLQLSAAVHCGPTLISCQYLIITC